MELNSSETVVQEAPSGGHIPWGRIIVWVGLLGLLTLLAFGLMRSQQQSLSVGEPAPSFALTSYEGQNYSLESLKGKVVVLNIWASWCVTCKDEAAALENTWRSYQGRGDVVFLGVDYTDTESAAKAYLQKYNITYPNGPDLRTKIYQSFRATGVPETYVIDRNGVLRYALKGPFSSEAQIRAAIEPLLEQ